MMLINERQEYLLYKARMEYEKAKEDRNIHLDPTSVKTSMKKWGEELDKLNGVLAMEAVEYIGILQDAYERRGYEINDLEQRMKGNTPTNNVPQAIPTTNQTLYGNNG